MKQPPQNIAAVDGTTFWSGGSVPISIEMELSQMELWVTSLFQCPLLARCCPSGIGGGGPAGRLVGFGTFGRFFRG